MVHNHSFIATAMYPPEKTIEAQRVGHLAAKEKDISLRIR